VIDSREESTLSTTPAITIENLTFAYESNPVLEDVNLSVVPRDFACVVGPNGGGKTTLLKLVLGLLRPQRGRVRVLGRSPQEARVRVGYLAQHAHLDPQFPVSVMDVVMMGRLGRQPSAGRYRRLDRQVAAEALDQVGLTEMRGRSLSALSGGQRQRVLLARTLACEPDLLMFDEPTAHLDPAVQDDLYDMLRKLNERLTIVMVSHDVGFVSEFVKSVICVNRRVYTHPTSEINGRIIGELYGQGVRMVRHDHHCQE
jgi:zinc transport system ATP-binding protein